MFTTTKAVRFDDSDEQAGYVYHGWNYVIVAGSTEFSVRTYDDEPGQVTVIEPPDARLSPVAHDLVKYLLSSLRTQAVLFYDPTRGVYRRVDLESLDFL